MNLNEKRYIELPYQIHSHHLITSICLQDYGVHFLAPLYFLLESWKIIIRYNMDSQKDTCQAEVRILSKPSEWDLEPASFLSQYFCKRILLL